MKRSSSLFAAVLAGLLSLAVAAPSLADPPPWSAARHKHHQHHGHKDKHHRKVVKHEKHHDRWGHDHRRHDHDRRWHAGDHRRHDHDRHWQARDHRRHDHVDRRWNDRRWDDGRRYRPVERRADLGRCREIADKVRENEYYIRRWEGTGRHEKIVRGAKKNLPGQYRELQECRYGYVDRDDRSYGGQEWGRYSSYDAPYAYGADRDFDWKNDWPLVVGGLLNGNLGY